MAAPLTALPIEAAGLLVMAVLVVAALAVPLVLGVRDWRCYGLVLLWPPVISAIQTGERDALVRSGCGARLALPRSADSPSRRALGITLAVKFFLWPLVVWLAATRRYASAGLRVRQSASALLLVSWAAIGFAGLVDYPDLLRRLEDVVGDDSYTAYIVGLDLGLPSAVARALWLALGLGLLGCVVVRRPAG